MNKTYIIKACALAVLFSILSLSYGICKTEASVNAVPICRYDLFDWQDAINKMYKEDYGIEPMSAPKPMEKNKDGKDVYEMTFKSGPSTVGTLVVIEPNKDIYGLFHIFMKGNPEAFKNVQQLWKYESKLIGIPEEDAKNMLTSIEDPKLVYFIKDEANKQNIAIVGDISEQSGAYVIHIMKMIVK